MIGYLALMGQLSHILMVVPALFWFNNPKYWLFSTITGSWFRQVLDMVDPPSKVPILLSAIGNFGFQFFSNTFKMLMIIQYLSVAIRVRSMVKKKGYLSRGWVIFINILQPLLTLAFLGLSSTASYVLYNFFTLSAKDDDNDNIVDGRERLATIHNRL